MVGIGTDMPVDVVAVHSSVEAILGGGTEAAAAVATRDLMNINF